MRMILDIGSGGNPRGDINTDLVNYPFIDCICNAQYLPFKDNSFDIVRSYYIIEHCLYPTKMVLESIRVAKKKVEIATDDIHFLGYFIFYIIRKGFLINESEHLYGWTRYYMENFLRIMNIPYKYKVMGIIDYDWGKNYRQWNWRLFYWLIIRFGGMFLKPTIKVEIYKEGK